MMPCRQVKVCLQVQSHMLNLLTQLTVPYHAEGLALLHEAYILRTSQRRTNRTRLASTPDSPSEVV